jgi:hypothetical protein
MNQRRVVGLTPWLPGSLGRSSWWLDPAPAERLAALRIGVGLVLLIDVLVLYWPHVGAFFGAGSLGSPEVFAGRYDAPRWNWSLLLGLDESWQFSLAFAVWAVAALGLMLGVGARFCAFVAWALSVSVIHANPYLHNGGDFVRTILLFYLMLSPCGAVWSLRPSPRPPSDSGEKSVFVAAWPLRLLFLQMTIMYFMNGVHKLPGPGWRSGDITHYLLQDLTWSRLVLADVQVPYWLAQTLTWTVLVWELTFPLLVLLPWARNTALWMGVAFHVATGLGMELGLFPLYALCMYLPLVPWERCGKEVEQRASAPTLVGS